MAKFKFDIDPKEPREEQIARHKDFGKVMQNYQRMTNPLYKTPLYIYRKIFIGVVLVLSLVWMIVEFGDHESDKQIIPTDTIHKKDSVKTDSDKPKPLSKNDQ